MFTSTYNMSKSPSESSIDYPSWLLALDEQDLAFLRRFLLASGSLKDLAKAYEVSYPTIRIRLDRLIEKVQLHDTAQPVSSFEKHLRSLVASGRLDTDAFKSILQSHHDEEHDQS